MLNRSSSPRSRLSAGFATSAVLALLVLALGAAGHFAHHYLDRDCETDRGASHPCATCSVLHGGVLAEGEIRVAPSTPAEGSAFGASESAAFLALVLGRYAPRAPPLA